MSKSDLFLFLDANVYLKFYSFSEDDYEVFSNFYKNSIKYYKIVTTDLLIDEFNRAKEKRFRELLNKPLDIKINMSTKNLVLFADDEQNFEELKALEKDLKIKSKEYTKKYNEILDKLREKFLKKSLLPDLLIERIFKAAHHIPLSEGIFHKARRRLNLNNPPGERNGLGDRIHWESLLNGISDGYKLVIISNDSDFFSLIDSNAINPFLRNEWEAKNSSIEIYKNLNDFFKQYSPEFELQDDISEEINEKIEILNESDSFAQTHTIISELVRYLNHFSRNHIKLIIKAYQSNSQINQT